MNDFLECIEIAVMTIGTGLGNVTEGRHLEFSFDPPDRWKYNGIDPQPQIGRLEAPLEHRFRDSSGFRGYRN